MLETVVQLDVEYQHIVNTIAVFQQGDYNSQQIIFTLTKRGEEIVIPEKSKARCLIIKPDKTEIFKDCEINDGKIILSFDAQMLAASGRTLGQILMTNSNSQLSTVKFSYYVNDSLVSDPSLISQNEFDSLTQALSVIDECENSVKEMQSSKVDKATLATTIDEAIDKKAILKDEKGSVGMDLLSDEVKSAITGGGVAIVGYGSVGYNNLDLTLQDLFGKDIELLHTTTQGKVCYGSVGSTLQFNTNTNSKTAYVEVSEGDRYVFNDNETWWIVDENNSILSYFEDGDVAYRIAPAGASKIYFNEALTANTAIRKMAVDKIDNSKFDAELQAKLSLIKIDRSPNLINPDEIIKGRMLKIADGSESEASSESTSSKHAITGFIPVSTGDTIKVSSKGKAYTADKICVYDTGRNFIRTESKVNEVIIANEEAYIRIDFYDANIASNEDYVKNNFQIEKGNITSYRKYNDMKPYIDIDSINKLQTQMTSINNSIGNVTTMKKGSTVVTVPSSDSAYVAFLNNITGSPAIIATNGNGDANNARITGVTIQKGVAYAIFQPNSAQSGQLQINYTIIG